MRREVRVSYDAENYPHFEDAIFSAAGRRSDFSGMGLGLRDHGWVCQGEIEAEKIKRGLKAIGLSPTTDVRATCHDCGLPYSDPGFADLLVPDPVWEEVAPDNGNGLLCPTCLTRAVARAGIISPCKFVSGPWTPWAKEADEPNPLPDE